MWSMKTCAPTKQISLLSPNEQSLMNACQGEVPVPVISSAQLFRGRQAFLIEHQGEHYQLRITRQGKLILTK